MQSGVSRGPESQTRHDSKKPSWSWSLEGLSTFGRLGLKGLFLFVYPNLLSSGLIYRLEGRRRGFSPSSSVSSSITHWRVMLYLHLSSLTLVLYFYCLLFIFMHQSSIGCLCFIYSYFHTQISQSKSNLAIIFNWGSKQALVF